MFHGDDFSHGADGSRHIKHKWPWIGGYANRKRIGADERFSASIRMNEYFSGGECDADQTFGRATFGIIANHSDVGGIAHRHHRNTVFSCRGSEFSQAEFAGCGAESVLSIDI